MKAPSALTTTAWTIARLADTLADEVQKFDDGNATDDDIQTLIVILEQNVGQLRPMFAIASERAV